MDETAAETVTYSEWLEHRACTRKLGRYDNIVDANWDVLLLWKAGKHAETYNCTYCEKIHITTNDSNDHST